MLIQLFPTPPSPSILFSIEFPDIVDTLPTPTSWLSQLHHLTLDDLELPKFTHALDKAALIPCILERVTFDVGARTVTCVFVDGSVLEWEMIDCDENDEGEWEKEQRGWREPMEHHLQRKGRGQRKGDERGWMLMDVLERIAKDVCDSAILAEEEEEQERRNQEREQRRLEMEAQLFSNTQNNDNNSSGSRGDDHNGGGAGKVRHKKQRSLLMTIVASIVPSRPSSPAPIPPPPQTPPPLPPLSIPRSPSPSPKSSMELTRPPTPSSPVSHRGSFSFSLPPTPSSPLSSESPFSIPEPTTPGLHNVYTSYSSYGSYGSYGHPRNATEFSTASEAPLNQPITSRFLRRRARSALVDTFRQFALGEIGRRIVTRAGELARSPGLASLEPWRGEQSNDSRKWMGKGRTRTKGYAGGYGTGAGYYTWIVNSMLRRVEERMDEVLSMGGIDPHAALVLPFPSAGAGGEEGGYFALTSLSLPPSPVDSDSEDGEETGTLPRAGSIPASPNPEADARLTAIAREVRNEDEDAPFPEDDGLDDDDVDIETDTDGSSLHTPSSSRFSTLSTVISKRSVRSKTAAIGAEGRRSGWLSTQGTVNSISSFVSGSSSIEEEGNFMGEAGEEEGEEEEEFPSRLGMPDENQARVKQEEDGEVEDDKLGPGVGIRRRGDEMEKRSLRMILDGDGMGLVDEPEELVGGDAYMRHRQALPSVIAPPMAQETSSAANTAHLVAPLQLSGEQLQLQQQQQQQSLFPYQPQFRPQPSAEPGFLQEQQPKPHPYIHAQEEDLYPPIEHPLGPSEHLVPSGGQSYRPPATLRPIPITPSSNDNDTSSLSLHTRQAASSSPPNAIPRSPSPPAYRSRRLTPPYLSLPQPLLSEYQDLLNLSQRLAQLLVLTRARAQHVETEQRQREDMLEVKGRRRAWLNKKLRVWGKGRRWEEGDGDGDGDGDGEEEQEQGREANARVSPQRSSKDPVVVGQERLDLALFFAPFRSSPLARFSWTAEEYEYVPPPSMMRGSFGLVMGEMAMSRSASYESSSEQIVFIDARDEGEGEQVMLQDNSERDERERWTRWMGDAQSASASDSGFGFGGEAATDEDGALEIPIMVQDESAMKSPQHSPTKEGFKKRRSVQTGARLFPVTEAAEDEETEDGPCSRSNRRYSQVDLEQTDEGTFDETATFCNEDDVMYQLPHPIPVRPSPPPRSSSGLQLASTAGIPVADGWGVGRGQLQQQHSTTTTQGRPGTRARTSSMYNKGKPLPADPNERPPSPNALEDASQAQAAHPIPLARPAPMVRQTSGKGRPRPPPAPVAAPPSPPTMDVVKADNVSEDYDHAEMGGRAFERGCHYASSSSSLLESAIVAALEGSAAVIGTATGKGSPSSSVSSLTLVAPSLSDAGKSSSTLSSSGLSFLPQTRKDVVDQNQAGGPNKPKKGKKLSMSMSISMSMGLGLGKVGSVFSRGGKKAAAATAGGGDVPQLAEKVAGQPDVEMGVPDGRGMLSGR